MSLSQATDSTPPIPVAPPTFDARGFRNVLGSFATGVTIMTTRAADGAPVGMTVNSFNAVSLDPPMVLWSIAKNALSLQAFVDTGHWAVHILAADQQALSDQFARRGTEKFAGVPLDSGVAAIPLLRGCSARLQCRTSFRYEGGDHVILVGEVLDFERSEAAPLVFHSGRYAIAMPKAAPLSLSSEGAADSDAPVYSENFLGYLLWRAFHQFQARVRDHVTRAGLSMLEHYALCAMVVQDGRTLEDVNRFTALTGEQVSEHTLAQLAAKGLLLPAESGSEGLRLSAAGRETTLRIMAEGMAIESGVTQALGDWESVSLKNLLKKLIVQTNPGLPHPWDRG